MPSTPSPTQGAITGDHGGRPAPNGVGHGRCGRTLVLLPDEDPAAFERHEALWLAAWAPRDLHEQHAAEVASRCLWREGRADRLEALVMTDLLAAARLPDPVEAEIAKSAAFNALNTLLRYRARIEREQGAAMQTPESLRQRRLAPAERPSEPEPARRLNRHQRRVLAAITRRAA